VRHSASTPRCLSTDTYNPYPGVMDNVPAARGYTGGFGTDLMLKDLGLATDAAKQARQPVPMGAVAQQLYQLWSSRGAGGQDFSSIINLLKKEA
jgi:3-hydroxyisobutyrate dehydrogenase